MPLLRSLFARKRPANVDVPPDYLTQADLATASLNFSALPPPDDGVWDKPIEDFVGFRQGLNNLNERHFFDVFAALSGLYRGANDDVIFEEIPKFIRGDSDDYAIGDFWNNLSLYMTGNFLTGTEKNVSIELAMVGIGLKCDAVNLTASDVLQKVYNTREVLNAFISDESTPYEVGDTVFGTNQVVSYEEMLEEERQSIRENILTAWRSFAEIKYLLPARETKTYEDRFRAVYEIPAPEEEYDDPFPILNVALIAGGVVLVGVLAYVFLQRQNESGEADA